MKAAILAAFLIGMTAAAVQAQNAPAASAPIEFRVVASADNISGCRGLDGAFSRVNTITSRVTRRCSRWPAGLPRR